MKTILKIIFIISYLIAIVVFAVWWGLEFKEYSDNIVYSDNNLFRSVQYVTEVGWGLSMATSPIWSLGSVVLLVRYLFPSLKIYTMNKHPRHEVRYWPLFRKPEDQERAFPPYFLLKCFIALGLWILIAYLLS